MVNPSPMSVRIRVVALMLASAAWVGCSQQDSDRAVDEVRTPEPSSSAGTTAEDQLASELTFTQTFFKAAPGGRVRFEVRVDTDELRQLNRWEWDFDGSGGTDLVTRRPEASHVYDELFDGRVTATSTDTAGRSVSASAPVTIANFTPEPPFAPTAVTATRSGQDLVVTWEADPTDVERWVVSVEGQPVAAHDADARAIRVPNFPFGSVDEIAVAGLSADGVLGPKTFAAVDS